MLKYCDIILEPYCPPLCDKLLSKSADFYVNMNQDNVVIVQT